ncbi:MAG: ABC transporter ATP-binding protein [Verrucomicrobiota bacterium]|nr:ABC transporter ATP-binding protein [Flavobacteriales bacterium]MDZ4814678.1 ABC transporter ATP-binding protein [Verrucomicrobiota bacterium]
MSDVVISVEGLGKKYTIGGSHAPGRKYQTLQETLLSWPRKALSSFKAGNPKNEFWALKDISFEVKTGEILGIIGRNGAGKSTLLKILSRITEPTQGRVVVNGRIGALLEVGTGFHPELTGRENIYLSGAILGMKRWEINNKFDEIVEFAELEKFIDTPAKHYSSGMYMRLGFAVAAHLEPEILVIDEVLAVGDIQFQKKCLGKINSVSTQGRTVIFVSHNMTAVKSLCQEIIVLDNGSITCRGETNWGIDSYLSQSSSSSLSKSLCWNDNKALRNEAVVFKKASIESDNEVLKTDTKFSIFFEFECYVNTDHLNMSLVLYTREGVCVFNSGSDAIRGEQGIYRSWCHIPANLLNSEYYTVRILVVKDTSTALIDVDNIISFEVTDIERNGAWHGKWIGIVRPTLQWDFRMEQKNDCT